MAGQCSRVEVAVHRVLRRQDAHSASPVAGGLLGQDLGDVQPRQRERRACGFRGEVGGVVGADKEVGTGVGETSDAGR